MKHEDLGNHTKARPNVLDMKLNVIVKGHDVNTVCHDVAWTAWAVQAWWLGVVVRLG